MSSSLNKGIRQRQLPSTSQYSSLPLTLVLYVSDRNFSEDIMLMDVCRNEVVPTLAFCERIPCKYIYLIKAANSQNLLLVLHVRDADR